MLRLSFFLVVLVNAATVAAQASEEARALFEAGTAAYEAGRYAQASDYFERCYEQTQAPEVLYNAAFAAERGGDPARAASLYERFLTTGAPEADLAQARERLAAVRAAIPEEAPAEPEPEPEPAPEPEPPPRASSIEPWGWVVAGVGAAAVIVAGVLWALRDEALSEAFAQCTETACSPAAREPYARAGDLNAASQTMFVVGGVAIAAGVAWGVVSLVLPTNAEVAVVPYVDRHTAAIAIGGAL